MKVSFQSKDEFWSFFDKKLESLESLVKNGDYQGDVDAFISLLRECVLRRDGNMLKTFVEGIPHHILNMGVMRSLNKFLLAVEEWPVEPSRNITNWRTRSDFGNDHS